MNLQFSPKKTGEMKILAFDIANWLPYGITISGVVFTITVVQGVDGNVNAMVAGPPSIDGSKVSQKFQSGVPGTTYSIQASCTLSNGETLIPSANLLVISNQQST